jgi:polysaccharide pyruvyl transferase WcaK-like protein
MALLKSQQKRSPHSESSLAILGSVSKDGFNMNKTTIGLVGYYGYGNYGDELFRSVWAQYLTNCEFRLFQDQFRRPFYTKPLAGKVASVDAILIGGGDLVIPNYWTDQYFEDAFLDKPIYMHGLGVPTWGGADAKVIERMARFFQHPNVRWIHVRDVESKMWIEKHLRPSVDIVTTPDVVCALDLPDAPKPEGPPIFGLVTRKQKPGEIKWENVRALCDKARDLGYRMRQIVLATGLIGQEDIENLDEFSFPGMEVVVSETIGDLTKAIGECSLLASMKFHGCVVASMYGVPSVMLITTDKFRNFYKLMEREELVAHHRHVDLPDRISRHMAVIPAATRRDLRSQAAAGLVALREKLEADMDSSRRASRVAA